MLTLFEKLKFKIRLRYKIEKIDMHLNIYILQFL